MSSFDLIECMRIARQGFETWAAKPHNARWFRKVDGTPIPNDVIVNIAEAFRDAMQPAPRIVELEAEIATLRGAVGVPDELRKLLREVLDGGLIYWEPVTARGYAAKADMIARCEQVLAAAPAPPTVQPVPAGVPDGWKLVPVEPTEAMITKGRYGGLKLGKDRLISLANIYRAMLAATPAPPTVQPREGGRNAPAERAVLPRLTDGMIRAACRGHYGTDNIDGVDLAFNGTDYRFRTAFERMWRGIRKHLADSDQGSVGP